MVFEVEFTRQEGWILPRFRACMIRLVRANVQIEDVVDPDLRRLTRVASLFDPDSGERLDFPSLFDVQITAMKKGFMALSGVERVQQPLVGKTVEYAQSWVLHALGA